MVQYSEALDHGFAALAHPTRRDVLERLAHGPATLGELADPYGLTLNGIKKHVALLERADLVVTARVGRTRECRLGPAQLREASAWIDGYRRAWETRLDAFVAHVEGR